MTPILKYGDPGVRPARFAEHGVAGPTVRLPDAEPLDDPAAAIARALGRAAGLPAPCAKAVVARRSRGPCPGHFGAPCGRDGRRRGPDLTRRPASTPTASAYCTPRDGPPGGAGRPLPSPADEIRARVASFAHDPADRGNLAYLATTEEGAPDRIEPRGDRRRPGVADRLLRDASAAGYHGIHEPGLPDLFRRPNARAVPLAQDARFARPASEAADEGSRTRWAGCWG